jgi:hypothetical protein
MPSEARTGAANECRARWESGDYWFPAVLSGPEPTVSPLEVTG